jgi:hypothetical protein
MSHPRKELEKRLKEFGNIANNIKKLLESEYEMSDIDFYAISFAIVLMKEIVKPHGNQEKWMANIVNYEDHITEIMSEKKLIAPSNQTVSYFTSQPTPIKPVLDDMIRDLVIIRDLVVDKTLLIKEANLKKAVTLSATDLAKFSNLVIEDRESVELKLNGLKEATATDAQVQRTLEKKGSPVKSLSTMISSLGRVQALKEINPNNLSAKSKTKRLYAICMLYIISGHCGEILRHTLKKDKKITRDSPVYKAVEESVFIRGQLAHFNMTLKDEKALEKAVNVSSSEKQYISSLKDYIPILKDIDNEFKNYIFKERYIITPTLSLTESLPMAMAMPTLTLTSTAIMPFSTTSTPSTTSLLTQTPIALTTPENLAPELESGLLGIDYKSDSDGDSDSKKEKIKPESRVLGINYKSDSDSDSDNKKEKTNISTTTQTPITSTSTISLEDKKRDQASSRALQSTGSFRKRKETVSTPNVNENTSKKPRPESTP